MPLFLHTVDLVGISKLMKGLVCFVDSNSDMEEFLVEDLLAIFFQNDDFFAIGQCSKEFLRFIIKEYLALSHPDAYKVSEEEFSKYFSEMTKKELARLLERFFWHETYNNPNATSNLNSIKFSKLTKMESLLHVNFYVEHLMAKSKGIRHDLIFGPDILENFMFFYGDNLEVTFSVLKEEIVNKELFRHKLIDHNHKKSSVGLCRFADIQIRVLTFVYVFIDEDTDINGLMPITTFLSWNEELPEFTLPSGAYENIIREIANDTHRFPKTEPDTRRH